jgi:hypothetical protein
MKEAKLTREQSQQVRRHLILGSAVIEEIKTAHQEIKGKRKGEVFTLSSIVSGKIVKKYRGIKWLSSQTGIPRKNLGSLRRSKCEAVRGHTRKRAQNVTNLPYSLSVPVFAFSCCLTFSHLIFPDCTYCCHHVLESHLPPLSIRFVLFF